MAFINVKEFQVHFIIALRIEVVCSVAVEDIRVYNISCFLILRIYVIIYVRVWLYCYHVMCMYFKPDATQWYAYMFYQLILLLKLQKKENCSPLKISTFIRINTIRVHYWVVLLTIFAVKNFGSVNSVNFKNPNPNF